MSRGRRVPHTRIRGHLDVQSPASPLSPVSSSSSAKSPFPKDEDECLALQKLLEAHMQDVRKKQITEAIVCDLVPKLCIQMEDTSEADCLSIARIVVAVAGLLGCPPGFVQYLLSLSWTVLPRSTLSAFTETSKDLDCRIVNGRLHPRLMDVAMDFIYHPSRQGYLPDAFHLPEGDKYVAANGQGAGRTQRMVYAVLSNSTPLHAASMAGNASVVDLLLHLGADSTVADACGRRPVEVVPTASVRKKKSEPRVCRLLLLQHAFSSWSSLLAWAGHCFLCLLCLLGLRGGWPAELLVRYGDAAWEERRKQAQGKARKVMKRFQSLVEQGRSSLEGGTVHIGCRRMDDAVSLLDSISSSRDGSLVPFATDMAPSDWDEFEITSKDQGEAFVLWCRAAQELWGVCCCEACHSRANAVFHVALEKLRKLLGVVTEERVKRDIAAYIVQVLVIATDCVEEQALEEAKRRVEAAHWATSLTVHSSALHELQELTAKSERLAKWIRHREADVQLQHVLETASVPAHIEGALACLKHTASQEVVDQANDLLATLQEEESARLNLQRAMAERCEDSIDRALREANKFGRLQQDVETAAAARDRLVARKRAINLLTAAEDAAAAPMRNPGGAMSTEEACRCIESEVQARLHRLEEAIAQARASSLGIARAKKLQKCLVEQVEIAKKAVALEKAIEHMTSGGLKSMLLQIEKHAASGSFDPGSRLLAPIAQRARTKVAKARAVETLTRAVEQAEDVGRLEGALVAARSVGLDSSADEHAALFRTAHSRLASLNAVATAKKQIKKALAQLDRSDSDAEVTAALIEASKYPSLEGEVLRAHHALKQWAIRQRIAKELEENVALALGGRADSETLGKLVKSAAAIGLDVGEARRVVKVTSALEKAQRSAEESAHQLETQLLLRNSGAASRTLRERSREAAEALRARLEAVTNPEAWCRARELVSVLDSLVLWHEVEEALVPEGNTVARIHALKAVLTRVPRLGTTAWDKHIRVCFRPVADLNRVAVWFMMVDTIAEEADGLDNNSLAGALTRAQRTLIQLQCRVEEEKQGRTEEERLRRQIEAEKQEEASRLAEKERQRAPPPPPPPSSPPCSMVDSLTLIAEEWSSTAWWLRSDGQEQVCEFFLQGYCARGDQCPCAHERPRNARQLQSPVSLAFGAPGSEQFAVNASSLSGGWDAFECELHKLF